MEHIKTNKANYHTQSCTGNLNHGDKYCLWNHNLSYCFHSNLRQQIFRQVYHSLPRAQMWQWMYFLFTVWETKQFLQGTIFKGIFETITVERRVTQSCRGTAQAHSKGFEVAKLYVHRKAKHFLFLGHRRSRPLTFKL